MRLPWRVAALVATLNKTGTWIAQIGPHFVVVDGYAPNGSLLIRDPWFEPGVTSGTKYQVTVPEFLSVWSGGGAFRRR